MMAASTRLRGRVKWFNRSSGFGFIECDGEKIFVHYTAVGAPGPAYLGEGEEVEFTLTSGLEGLQAADVRRVAA